MIELEGEVESVIYRNDVNSYLIANLETQEELLTIVGYMPFVDVGDSLKVIGNYVEHKEYGTQFKVETFEKQIPQTLDALERYLANAKIKGVGPATAKKIVTTFGQDTVSILKYSPYELAKIRGITKEKALEISEEFNQNMEVWNIVSFLERFGIGAEHAQKVYDELGVNAIEKIEENPYLLIDITRGVDFRQIDKMAIDMGIEPNNTKRIKSGIKYALLKITYQGNCCVLKQNLINYVLDLLGVTKDEVEEVIIKMNIDKEIMVEKREDIEWIYLYYYYKVEQEIAQRLFIIDRSKNIKKIPSIEKELKQTEKQTDIILSEKQTDAILAVNNNNVTVITGGPGTGKTTIIKTIIDLFEKRGNKVVLCAPTGRAAKKMTETTGREASTLHRLLEIGKVSDDIFYQKDNHFEGVPIDGDVVIVDELSMVDMFLMNYLLNSIYRGTKLILVGDSDQLPSVGPGSVLKDIVSSETMQVVHLDKVFRQAAKSKIITNAHRINNGEGFVKKSEEEKDAKQDFFYIQRINQEDMLKEVVSLCTGRLKRYGDYDFFSNIQVLTPTKKGILGTKELNKVLQQNLNPHKNGQVEKSSMGATFRIGDRIMQIKNNYDIEWKRKDSNESKYGIFNGEIGTITDIDEKNGKIEIEFDDDKISIYDEKDLEQIEHSYSITIHKAQRK